MIKQVLADHPLGLRTTEIHAEVEGALGRVLSRSTVKGTLAQNPAFSELAAAYTYSAEGCSSGGSLGSPLDHFGLATGALSRPALTETKR
jgi:hypothetical protein